jgi:ATP-binding cassette subfamily B protein
MKIPKTIIAFLWHFIKRQPIAFFIIFVTSLIWSINEVLFPYFIKLIINAINTFHGDPHNIYTVLTFPVMGLLGSWLIMDVGMRMQGITMISAFPRFRANIREAVYNYVKHHSHDFFSNNFAGSIAQKLASLPNSCQSVLEVLFFNFSATILGFILTIILMWFTQPLFALILFVWFCLHMGVTFLFLRTGNQYWQSHSEAVATLSGRIVDSITNIFSVRLFARSKYESAYFKKTQADEISKAKKALWYMEFMRICQSIFGIALITTMIFTLIHGWINGWVTVGDFSLIGMLSLWILGMVWYMSYHLSIFVREIGTIGESLSLITAGHGIIDSSSAGILKVNKGEIRFKDVTFAYPKNLPVFDKLNIVIPAGQKVGLVGFSGSGKSTFVNLLLRFYDLKSGQISIDGQNIATVTQDSLREQISMIPQDPTLFHRSLMENIRYGRLDATDKEVKAASKLAHCHEFIKNLPDRYQTSVGERGLKLSGGQRQRISIARAILKNAPILVLDEATSALDSVTEKFIHGSLTHLMQNKTTIVIAHRLSTLADMDRILVFHQGQIVEDGAPEELLKDPDGYYRELWDMQSDGVLPEEI